MGTGFLDTSNGATIMFSASGLAVTSNLLGQSLLLRLFLSLLGWVTVFTKSSMSLKAYMMVGFDSVVQSVFAVAFGSRRFVTLLLWALSVAELFSLP